MTTTESCDQPTHTPSGINSQAQNATCATARRRSSTAQVVGCTWSSSASWRISAAG
jgi:hypothetical protein